MNLKIFGKSTPAQAKKTRPKPLESRKQGVYARYDSAQTSSRNARHWQWSDNLSADAANNPATRKIIRERARYEYDNNSYCRGMVTTLANGVVGMGPALQMRTKDEAMNEEIEALWNIYSKKINLPSKLRAMKKAKVRDGEAFAQFVTRDIPGSPVSLDLIPIECDRVTDPSFSFTNLLSNNNIDGIKLDKYGYPVSYSVLKYHPGGDTIQRLSNMFKADTVPAEYIIHWFRNDDRPEQHRGVCEYQAALALFSILRDYTMATLNSAQTAALLATVIQTSQPPDDENTQPGDEESGVEPEPRPEAMDMFSLEQGMTTVLPEGYQIAQIKAEQPTGTFTEFEKTILRQIGRALSMPFNIVAGDSSGYNYASGRLDHQDFFRFLQVERAEMSSGVMDRIFSEFLKELSLLPSFTRLRSIMTSGRSDFYSLPPHDWYYEDYKHVDPMKEASAFIKLYEQGASTLADWYAAKGKDWRKEITQWSEERKTLAELGYQTPENSAPQIQEINNG